MGIESTREEIIHAIDYLNNEIEHQKNVLKPLLNGSNSVTVQCYELAVKALNEKLNRINSSNDIEIVNNAKNKVDVSVLGKRIEINLINQKVELRNLHPGDIFKDSNSTEYIVLEHFRRGGTKVILKDILWDDVLFDEDDSNNWANSSLRNRLSKEFLPKIEEVFNKENVLWNTSDLLSLDGYDDYGVVDDKVSLLTIDEYRKYRKYLGKNIDKDWWSVTPDSTYKYNGLPVCYFSKCGDIGHSSCNWGKAVRPDIVLKSSIMVEQVI